MKLCIRSANTTAHCESCGALPQELHKPIIKRGHYCPRCCPACATSAPKKAAAPQPVRAPTVPVLHGNPSPSQPPRATRGTETRRMIAPRARLATVAAGRGFRICPIGFSPATGGADRYKPREGERVEVTPRTSKSIEKEKVMLNGSRKVRK